MLRINTLPDDCGVADTPSARAAVVWAGHVNITLVLVSARTVASTTAIPTAVIERGVIVVSKERGPDWRNASYSISDAVNGKKVPANRVRADLICCRRCPIVGRYSHSNIAPEGFADEFVELR